MKILILSGAGLSAESGISTFRDSDGLWENHDVMEICSTEGFAKDRDKVNEFYNKRRIELKDKEPNLAHKTLAKLKREFFSDIAIVTQNIDDLLERAGCEEIIHLHGTLTDLRCEECGEIFDIGYESQNDKSCPKCESKSTRHNVVMFGEPAPMYEELDKLANSAEMFIVIGSSGQVLPLGWMAQWFDYSIINNIEKSEHLDSFFKKRIYKPATKAILEIEEEIKEFLKNS